MEWSVVLMCCKLYRARTVPYKEYTCSYMYERGLKAGYSSRSEAALRLRGLLKDRSVSSFSSPFEVRQYMRPVIVRINCPHSGCAWPPICVSLGMQVEEAVHAVKAHNEWVLCILADAFIAERTLEAEVRGLPQFSEHRGRRV